MESYYRLQYEILGYIDEGKVNEAKEYLENRIQHKDTDALTILGLLYIYGVGLEKRLKHVLKIYYIRVIITFILMNIRIGAHILLFWQLL